MIYLKIVSEVKLEGIGIGWSLTDKQGLIACHSNSDFFCERMIEVIEKEVPMICCFNIKMPPLRNSEYVFSLGIRQFNKVIFKVNDALPIQILSEDKNSLQGGYVIVENASFSTK